MKKRLIVLFLVTLAALFVSCREPKRIGKSERRYVIDLSFDPAVDYRRELEIKLSAASSGKTPDISPSQICMENWGISAERILCLSLPQRNLLMM